MTEEKKKKRGYLFAVVLVLIVILLFTALAYSYGTEPVHRTNITHTDEVGDVEDPDIDIVKIRSYDDK